MTMPTTTVSLQLPLRAIEPASHDITVGMSWRAHRDEDRLLVDPPAALYGVFDGAGGHGDGAGAATVAAEAVNRRVRAGLPGCQDLDDVQRVLDLALMDADVAVAGLDSDRPGHAAALSATTATIALVCRRPADPSRLVAVIANLGDSRAQLMHNGHLATVTLDHSFLSEPDLFKAKARQDRLDAAAQMTDLEDPMDRAAFAHRHLLANALTGSGVNDIRHYLVELMPGDRLILDSDGIHDNLTAAELEAVLLQASTAPEAAEHMVSAAWRRSQEEAGDTGDAADSAGTAVLGRAKPDDMTALVLDVRVLDEAAGGTGAYRLTPGGSLSLSLAPGTKQYLVSAADLQLLVARREGSWWVMQPGAAHGEPGSWQLTASQTLEFGRTEPGGFLRAPSDQVSRRHMALTVNEAADALVVTDLNSTNGTAVLGW